MNEFIAPHKSTQAGRQYRRWWLFVRFITAPLGWLARPFIEAEYRCRQLIIQDIFEEPQEDSPHAA